MWIHILIFMVILGVFLQVLGQVLDALRQDSNLYLCATRVLGVLAELSHELCSAFFGDAKLVRHLSTFLHLIPSMPSKQAGGACELGVKPTYCKMQLV